MHSFYIETYGCQMNIADSETMSGILVSAGFEQVDVPEQADLIIINTCTVRDSAVSRVKAQINRFRPLKKRRAVRLAIAGCLAQHEQERLLKELPVDYVIGPDHYRFLSQITSEKSVHVSTQSTPRDFYQDFPPVRKKGVNAWVPVMRGCDNFCSYCIVPHVRGREQSKPLSSVVSDVQNAVSEGFKEVTLLGQNVNSYRDGNAGFPELLEKVSMVNGLARLRFMTSHPKDFSDSLIRCFGGLPALCGHAHLPLQSGSDRVLAAMNRGYTAGHYMGLVTKLRRQAPSIAITTDILCGFPGETDADHRATIDIMGMVGFDAAFMFIFSPRAGTAAATLKEQVPRETKVARVNEVIALQTEITRNKYQACVGGVFEVLVEGPAIKSPGCVTARTRCFKNVILPGTAADTGLPLSVRITGSTGHALIAERKF